MDEREGRQGKETVEGRREGQERASERREVGDT